MKLGKIKFEVSKKMLIAFGIEMLLVGLYVAFDLLTKHFIFMPLDNKTMGSDDFIHIAGVIRFVAVHNTGASFGMFTDGNLALAIISAITVVVLSGFIFFSIKNRNIWLRAALILILAGGIGNTVDRFAFGYVRDFVYFELIDFAVFNFADSGLVIGTILLVIFVVFFYKPDTKPMYDKDGNLIEYNKKPRRFGKNEADIFSNAGQDFIKNEPQNSKSNNADIQDDNVPNILDDEQRDTITKNDDISEDK